MLGSQLKGGAEPTRASPLQAPAICWGGGGGLFMQGVNSGILKLIVDQCKLGQEKQLKKTNT